MKKLFILIVIFLVNEDFSFAQQMDSVAKKASWDLHGEVSGYIIPDEYFLLPIVSADHNQLHLEARYNYEDDKTASLFGGYNFSFGNKLSVDFTPMGGFAFGNTDGFVLGYNAEFSYWNLGFSTQAEYLFDFSDPDFNFFYSWNELYYLPADWIWFGVSAQRLREHQTSLDFQRGIFLAVQKKWLTVSGYYFNPFTSDDFWVVTLGVDFSTK